MPQLDIILPCYNPLPNWAENIVYQLAALKELLPDTEVFLYVVNDGSGQGVSTANIDFLKASLHNFTYLSYPGNRGKGYALRKGVEKALHDYCIYTDVDFPYKADSMVKVYKALVLEKYDIVVGVRDEKYYQNMKGSRVPLSKILKFLNRKIFNLPINDTQCGIKGFNKNGREIFLRTLINRYLFDLEFVFLAAKQPAVKFKAVPVELRPGIYFRKLNPQILLSESASFLKLVFKEYLKI